jgi:hypothetical protein
MSLMHDVDLLEDSLESIVSGRYDPSRLLVAAFPLYFRVCVIA